MLLKKLFLLLVAPTVFIGLNTQGKSLSACPTVQKKMACCADMSEQEAMECCKKSTTNCPKVNPAPQALDVIVPAPMRHQVVLFTLPIINKEQTLGHGCEFVLPAADSSPPRLITLLVPPLRAPPLSNLAVRPMIWAHS